MTREINGKILEGILVLDLADERGGFCSKLLADLGAEVINIEPPGGDSSRKLGPFSPADPGHESVSLSFFYNNLNKKSICLDLRAAEGKRTFEKLVDRADILVETCPPGFLDTLGLGAEELRHRNSALIHLSITPFGQSGPKAFWNASDTTLSALGGQAYVCDNGSGKPGKLFGMQSWYAASLFGAVSVLMHLHKRKRTGRGDFIDLSTQEAVASTLDHVLVDYFAEGRVIRRQDAINRDTHFATVPCSDGFILLTILRNWDTLCEIMAAENRARDLSDPKWREPGYREDHFEHILDVVKGWAGRHTRQELFELGQAMGFPWAPVATVREVLESPQLQSRRFFFEGNVFGQKAAVPGLPFQFNSRTPIVSNSWTPIVPSPPTNPGEHTVEVLKNLDTHENMDENMDTHGSLEDENMDTHGSLDTHGEIHNSEHEYIANKIPSYNNNILDGFRVLDLSRMLSGPYATRILADFGAEVIKVQTEKTAHGAEQNDTPYFSTWNRNKRSIRLDLDIAEAREYFLKLVAESDIVVENYSPRVMQNWGLTYDRLKAQNPSLVMLSLTAMGQTGPWRDYVGFAPTFHALSGVMSASSATADSPATIGHAYGDVVAGLYGAFSLLAALEFRDKTGKGLHIDLSAYEALCTCLGPALIDASMAQGRDNQYRWREGYDESVPDGFYLCRETDRWCAITVKNDSEWQTFRRILDEPELESDKFVTTEGRTENREAMDAIIGRWTAARSAQDIIRSLQEARLATGVVQDAEDIAKDKQLESRKFFVSLEHPKLGDTIADRSALWPWQHETNNWRSAPSLGEADRDIFVKWLGMSEEIFRSFIRQGIIR